MKIDFYLLVNRCQQRSLVAQQMWMNFESHKVKHYVRLKIYCRSSKKLWLDVPLLCFIFRLITQKQSLCLCDCSPKCLVCRIVAPKRMDGFWCGYFCLSFTWLRWFLVVFIEYWSAGVWWSLAHFSSDLFYYVSTKSLSCMRLLLSFIDNKTL